jgi:hypothetical protein
LRKRKVFNWNIYCGAILKGGTRLLGGCNPLQKISTEWMSSQLTCQAILILAVLSDADFYNWWSGWIFSKGSLFRDCNRSVGFMLNLRFDSSFKIFSPVFIYRLKFDDLIRSWYFTSISICIRPDPNYCIINFFIKYFSPLNYIISLEDGYYI